MSKINMVQGRKVIPIGQSHAESKSKDRLSYQYGLGLTSQFYFCGLPLRLDTYSKCAFQCSYCFAHIRGGAHRETTPRIYNSRQLSTHFERIQKNKPLGLIDELLANGQPIHFGGMADPFSSLERKYRASRDAMKVLSEVKHPTVISTKSDLLLDEEYLELLVQGNYIVQVSLSSLDEETIGSIDKGTPGPKRLMAMLKTLSDLGIPTACRIQPLLPGLDDQAVDVIYACAEAGVRHVAVEHLKLGVEKSWRGTAEMSKVLGINLPDYFKYSGAKRIGREWVLPPQLRIDTIRRLRSLTHVLGMSFGAADTDFLLLSDGGCCCSGADLISGFEHYFRFTYLEAARKGIGTGVIKLENLNDVWVPENSIARYVNSHSRLPSVEGVGADIAKYICENWNGSENGPSPKGLFGVVHEGETDEDSYNIYRISDELTKILND